MSDVIVSPSKWELKRIRVPLYMGKEDRHGMEFTIIAKVFGTVAVYPSIKMDSDGKGIEHHKDSYSVTAVACKMRITWARDECDAFKIAQYMGTMFPLELSYRTADKVMAGLPKWVAAWIKECRKSGGAKGGYVAPPDTTEEIKELMAKYDADRRRIKE